MVMLLAGEDSIREIIPFPRNKNAMDVMMGFAVVLAIVLAVGLFFILPTVITNWIKGGVQSSILINLIDGGVRLAIFLTYMILVSRMKDIKTVFRYHGARCV